MTTFSKIPKGYRNEGNQPKRDGIYIGVIRRPIDSQRMGRFLVWISDFGPDREEFWVPVSYASPFAGATNVDDNDATDKTAKGSQTAYGFWATPPDINNQLLCCFIDGDVASGYWFACIYQQNMNHMVPGIASSLPSGDSAMDQKFGEMGPPTVEYNKKRGDLTGTVTSKFDLETVERPVFEPLASQLVKQGLNADMKRGPSNSSARRDSPSRVFGMSTPNGNSFVLDDGATQGDPNEFIRLRTKSGVQLLIHETNGYIYMITKDGGSWVEINDQGIDMYSAGPISLNSGKDINISAAGKIGLQGSEGVHLAGGVITTYTSGDTVMFAEGDLIGYGNNVGFDANADATLAATRDVSLNAGRNILEGACGYASRNAKAIQDNSGGGAPHTVKGAAYLKQVVSRVPLAEPYADHFDGGGHGTIVGVSKSGQLLQNVTTSDGKVVAKPYNMPASQQAKVKLLYQKLKARGYNDAQSAAIIGAWMQESSLNPNITNSIGATGLGQWLGKRKTALDSFAASKGTSPNDLDTQLDFFQHELNTSEPKAKNMLMNATTVDEAMAGMNQYERFAGYKNPSTGSETGKRYSYAASVAASIKNGFKSG